VADDDLPATTCTVTWTQTTAWPNNFQVKITNTSPTPVNGWALRWEIPPGGNIDGVGFNATWDNVANAKPPNFTLNNKRCATG
jgi:peroxidase